MRYISIVSVVATVDGSQHIPGVEKQTGALPRKLSNVPLLTGATAKRILADLKKGAPV